MLMQEYIDEIKLELTGNLINIELPDATLEKVVNKAFREIQRYIDTTQLKTIPFAACIDLAQTEVASSVITRVYRTEGYMGDSNEPSYSLADPMYAQQWMIFTNGGSMYNLSEWILNYASYNTLLQLRNTSSTDLAFKQDRQANKLYINTAFDKPAYITVEYVPKFENVEQIKSDYWIDVLIRLSVALTKVTLGRIRSRYVQSNALWTQDGDTLLEEGKTELENLRETLRVNSQVIYPID